MKPLAPTLFLALFALFAGCRSAGRAERQANHQGQEVIIHQNHKHSVFCGHYMAANKWFYTSHHRHGLSCGHIQEAGVWVLE